MTIRGQRDFYCRMGVSSTNGVKRYHPVHTGNSYPRVWPGKMHCWWALSQFVAVQGPLEIISVGGGLKMKKPVCDNFY